MADPRKNLIATVNNHRAEFINNVCNRLQKLQLSHYEVIDFERHQEREEAFLEALLKGIMQTDHFSFVNYIEKTAEQRSNEGYSLEEVQNAVTIFEEELWHILTKYSLYQRTLVDMLALCNQVFGKAKDHLARVYLKKVQETQKELDDLRERFFAYRQDKKEVTDADSV